MKGGRRARLGAIRVSSRDSRKQSRDALWSCRVLRPPTSRFPFFSLFLVTPAFLGSESKRMSNVRLYLNIAVRREGIKPFVWTRLAFGESLKSQNSIAPTRAELSRILFFFFFIRDLFFVAPFIRADTSKPVFGSELSLIARARWLINFYCVLHRAFTQTLRDIA